VNTSASASGLIADLRSRGVSLESNLSNESDELMFSGIAYDSRRVRAGDLFLALPGTRTDGARFAADALDAGAVAVLCSREAARNLPAASPVIIAEDVVRAAGLAAAAFFDRPTDKLSLVGITGTNGKTSCTYLLESVWRSAEVRAGICGTISSRWPGVERVASMTTPGVVDLQALLAEMVRDGCTAAALEVSSHALSQHRVSGCQFDVAIFTNLTRDHLDYHADEDDYFAAKAILFIEYLREGTGTAVLNADDPRCTELSNLIGDRPVLTYSADPGCTADVCVTAKHMGLGGMNVVLRYRGDEFSFTTRLTGAPNLSNLAAAAAAAFALEIEPSAIVEGLAACDPVPGRLERVGTTRPAVFVDYAHTPDALERTLDTTRTLLDGGRLIVVFGCGGDRDRGKRPLMGEIAARLADVTVVTSDNPRSEDPAAIIAEIETGLVGHDLRKTVAELGSGADGFCSEPDRERAIRDALAIASPDDVVVVAGKGHEDYQEVNGKRRPFDDRALVAKICKSR
jgi:UDP-N-acetylmuramoyl-L-alanyl-D-glutamate--2,6-diaminopimelate ligase